ncbi:NAD-dependent epimerase/dehydratase family protein [Peribacillus sp. NPDC094092]|uniref:NAD-dependent epimerase/dehydratase family protein n=1 Tax=Peribacillus sp. NPDC094092 TaxID=3390611 RepID=UPI003D011B10
MNNLDCSFKNDVYYSDLNYILAKLSEEEKKKFENSSILITGCAGLLGFYFMSFFSEFFNELKLKKVIGIDNFQLGCPLWVQKINNKNVQILNLDIANIKVADAKNLYNCNYIIHMASIASPPFYRKYPLKTVEANVWGLRNLLDIYINKDINGFLYMSTSEIYGEPDQTFIPTPETYRGYVSTIGPRASYDESKRFGETLCYLYSKEYSLPIKIARPFNTFGPGMRLNDKRVAADFAQSVINNQNIFVYSDGSPTRTFCYVTDGIVGYIKAMLYQSFDVFNIGIDKPEISIKKLAEIYETIGKSLLNFNKNIVYKTSNDPNYLSDNPTRRCPDISKAKSLLNYNPTIEVEEGVYKFLTFLTTGGDIN